MSEVRIATRFEPIEVDEHEGSVTLDLGDGWTAMTPSEARAVAAALTAKADELDATSPAPLSPLPNQEEQ